MATHNGTDFADMLPGTGEDDVFYGGLGSDTMEGGGGDDTFVIRNALEHTSQERIDGGAGDKDVIGFAGKNQMFRLSANVTNVEQIVLREDSGNSGVNASNHAGPAGFTIVGNDGDNIIRGTIYNDEIFGSGGTDWLRGLDGNDLLDGGAGGDVLDGGAGADHLVGGSGPEYDYASHRSSPSGVYANLDTRADYPSNSESASRGFAGGFAVEDTYDGIEGLIGSNHDDTLIGNGRESALNGMDGADYLQAGNGKGDYLDGGAGGDRLVGGSGYDFATYASSPAGVYADLNTTASSPVPGGGFADGDTYESIEGLHGSNFADVLVAHERGSTIFGLEGADQLLGRNGADVFDGGAGNDVLSGGDGDDNLVGGAGNDTLDGGAGLDVAWMASFRRQSTVSGPLSDRTVAHADQLSGGAAATDRLLGVETINFIDGRLTEAGLFDLDDVTAGVARLYYAALDRAPDAGGLAHWRTGIESGQLTLTGIANFFAASPEFGATYGDLDARPFVQQLYRNSLDREGEEGGVDYWTNYLADHSRGEVVIGFSESPEHQMKTSPFMADGIMLA